MKRRTNERTKNSIMHEQGNEQVNVASTKELTKTKRRVDELMNGELKQKMKR